MGALPYPANCGTWVKTEEEFEKIVFNTSDILKDIVMLKRQIRGGKKSGIPDIVGVDADGNICIIEIKNTVVDSNIIPQVLEYAIWAETNPDSIKALWLEHDDKPENIDIAWDNLGIRILVIAPSILRSTFNILGKINYPVDLIEMNRWLDGDNTLLLVTKLEADAKSKIKPVKGLQTYGPDYYKKHRNRQSVDHFMRYANQLRNIVNKKKWELDLKFNASYCCFKYGFFIAFGITWIGSKTFAFFEKVSEKEAKEFKVLMNRYESEWNQAIYYIDPTKTKANDYISIFEKAYKRLTGK